MNALIVPMFTLVSVMIDALWVLGLAGVFATFSYFDYYRHLRHWRWRDVWQRPRLLVPLNLSLVAVSLGLALSGATAYSPAPWWETAIWAVLTLLFGAQMVIYWRAGLQHGWNARLDEGGE